MRVVRLSFAVALLVAALAHCGGDDDDVAGPGSATNGPDGSTADGSSNGGDGGSGGSDGGGGADANTGPRCDPSKPFGPLTMVLENSFRIDQSARLSPDELTLYYASYGHDGQNGQTELWTATRASTSVPFKNPTKIVELSTADSEGFPTITADGLTIYYSGKLGDAGYGILKATRANKAAPWSPPTMLTGLDLSMIYVTPDGSRLYGMKDLPGGPPYNADVHYVDLPYNGGPSTAVPGMQLPGLQYWPVVSPDQLTLYFSYPLINPYRWELAVAKRAAINVPFGTSSKIRELDDDAGADEHADWISPDGCTIYIRRVNGNIPNNASGLLQASRSL